MAILIIDKRDKEQISPLPNLDFKIMVTLTRLKLMYLYMRSYWKQKNLKLNIYLQQKTAKRFKIKFRII